MQRKNPATLLGKKLSGIHFHPLICAAHEAEVLKKELSPLFQLMAEKNVIEASQKDAMLNTLLQTFNTTPIWKDAKASSWHLKINKNSISETEAFAGWYVLHNLHKARNLWKTFCRPYTNLTNKHSTSELKKALITASLLCKNFEKNESPENREIKRHFLSLLLLIKNDKEELEALNKGVLGGVAFTKHNMPQQLIVSHGIPSKEKWIRANLKTISLLTEKLEKTLNDSQKKELELYRI